MFNHFVYKCVPDWGKGNKSQYFCDLINEQTPNIIDDDFFRMLEALRVKVLESVKASPEYRKLFIGLAEEGVEKNLHGLVTVKTECIILQLV